MTNEITPHIPLVACADLPATGGHVGPDAADFLVEEVPAYEPSGTGEHLYVFVQKTGLTTPECVDHLGRASGVQSREIGYAGLKDKHAVTKQWMSLPARGTPGPETWQLPSSIQIVQVSRHNNKLRTGHLRKNKFAIRLVDVDANAAPRAEAIASHLNENGLLNYFGKQRFGRQGNNLATALRWLSHNPARSSRFYKKLYPSVLQSEVFNRYLTERHALGLSQLILGEVVRLGESHSVFCVQDLPTEQARYATGELHLTGPIAGPKTKQAEAVALELEQRIIAEVGLDGEALRRLADFAPGARRDLVVRPEALTVRSDEQGALLLSFALPPGSYATQVIREFTREVEQSDPLATATPDVSDAAEVNA